MTGRVRHAAALAAVAAILLGIGTPLVHAHEGVAADLHSSSHQHNERVENPHSDSHRGPGECPVCFSQRVLGDAGLTEPTGESAEQTARASEEFSDRPSGAGAHRLHGARAPPLV